jgi:hypothetical protein
MQKSNIKMENDRLKFKNELGKIHNRVHRTTPHNPKISHGLTRINTDIKKYFIVLNKIKFGMGGWVICVHLWPINPGWGWVIQIFKNLRLSVCYFFWLLHFNLSFCFLNFDI